MIHIPNNICICSDCMQKTFDSINSGNVPYQITLKIKQPEAKSISNPLYVEIKPPKIHTHKTI